MIIIKNENIFEMSESELLSKEFLSRVMNIEDDFLKARVVEVIRQRARLLGCLTKANNLIRAMEKSRKKRKRRTKRTL